MNIITKSIPSKPKMMITGLPGSGKSTLASTLDKPLFIDIEGGLNNMNVARTETQPTFFHSVKALAEIHLHKDEYLKQYQTIVIDSIDWLVRQATEDAAKTRYVDENGKVHKNVEATLNKAGGGYGNGKQLLANRISARLLPALQALNNDGFAICLIAHVERKEMMESDGSNFERITPKIEPNTRDLFIEWVDNIFYLKRNDDGTRTLVLESDDVVLAKNRLGLSGEVSLENTNIQNILKGNKE